MDKKLAKTRKSKIKYLGTFLCENMRCRFRFRNPASAKITWLHTSRCFYASSDFHNERKVVKIVNIQVKVLICAKKLYIIYSQNCVILDQNSTMAESVNMAISSLFSRTDLHFLTVEQM